MAEKLGIYVHIPFCASKCGYCDFYSLAGCDRLMPDYHDAILRHIRESSRQMKKYVINSVYFGGGTPSWYGSAKIAEIFNELKISGYVSKDSEVTMEANPDSITLKDLKILKAAGFNRISFGAQSANDELLRLIRRRHNWLSVCKAVEAARQAGFDNISIDLIYGLPSQTKEDWADTVNKALALAPDHISAYGLKLEEGTPMYEQYNGSALLPTDDDQADMYLFAVETFERNGYRQYEISNFARPGKQSRHNIKYWLLRDYMGFGAGAHSSIGNVRYSYVKDVKKYIRGIRDGSPIIDEYNTIAFIERATEYIMLGMRTTRGISSEEYHNIFRSDFAPLEQCFTEFQRKGWAESDRGRWYFTPSGFLLSNLLIGILLDKQAEERRSGTPWIGAYEPFCTDEMLPEGDDAFYHKH